MMSQVLQGRALFAGQALRATETRVAKRGIHIAARAAQADRPLWLPGAKPPAHLDGSLPADYGFDPLGLGKDPQALRWYQQAELVHCRWAMLAVAGILIPGIFSAVGILNIPDWYNAGRVAQLNSFAPFSTLLTVQLFLFGWVESKRWVDFFKPGSQGEAGSFLGFEPYLKGSENGYPGGPIFDPLGFSKNDNLQELKTKELKNGRLALLAFLGFVAQYAATKKGPLANLGDHVLHPWSANFCTNGISVPSVGLIK